MGVGSGSTTWEIWQRRLERFDTAGLTVREFCRREGISEPSFYLWRKKLNKRGRNGAVASAPTSTRFVKMELPEIVSSISCQQEVVIRWPGGVEIDLGLNVDALQRVIGTLADRLAVGDRARRDETC